MNIKILPLLLLGAGLPIALSAQPYPVYSSDPYYDDGYGGVYAPAPPPPPRVVYSRPPMPGPGYYWVDGYYNYAYPRYVWVPGYWATPPYANSYWVAPRYSGNRFFVGFWGRGGGFGFSSGPCYRSYPVYNHYYYNPGSEHVHVNGHGRGHWRD